MPDASYAALFKVMLCYRQNLPKLNIFAHFRAVAMRFRYALIISALRIFVCPPLFVVATALWRLMALVQRRSQRIIQH